MSIETETFHNDQILLITLNEGRGNPFTPSLLNSLNNQLQEGKTRDNLIGIIITGKGSAFSVGGDLHGMKQALKKNEPDAYVSEVVPLANKVIMNIVSHPLPIITAINGSVAGGALSFALGGDYVISKKDCKLSFAFSRLALTPDSGTSVILKDRFGRNFALQALARGDVILSQEAMKMGAVDEITTDNDLITRAKDRLLELVKESQWAFSGTKKLINSDLIDQLKTNTELELQQIKTATKREEFGTKLDQMIESLQK